MNRFSQWKQSILVDTVSIRRQTPADVLVNEPPAKRQRLAPKLAPTANLTTAFIPPLLLPQSANGDVELEVEAYPKGKVLSRKGKEITINFVAASGQVFLVRGEFLFIDKHFTYRMRLLRTMENNKVVMCLKNMLQPSLVPRKLSGWDLKKTLSQKLKLTAPQASAKAAEILEPLMKVQTGKIDADLKAVQFTIDHLYAGFLEEEWFKKLAEVWAPIKFRNFHILGQFWSQQMLSQLTFAEIEYVAGSIRAKPFYWLLKDLNDLQLPSIPATDENFKKLKDLIGVDFTEKQQRIVKFYNSICDIIEKTSCESLTREQLSEISVCGPADPFGLIPACLSSEYKLLAVQGEVGFSGVKRFYRRDDLIARTTIQDRLKALLAGPTDEIPIKSTFSLINPTAEQQTAVDAITRKQNVIILLGDAGTGKTETGKKIFFSFPRGKIRAVSAYGEPAGRQKAEYGDGMTIDSFLNKIERQTKEGLKLAETEVLMIDEIGIVTANKLARLLNGLRNLKKLIMLGDEKQLSPIGAGPVIHPFIKAWHDTPFIHRLTKQFRVDKDSQVLIKNFNYYLSGEFGRIQYTNDLTSDNPMKVVQRLTIPARLFYPKLPEEKLERFTFYMQQLAEIHKQLELQGKSFDGTRIFVQREVDATMMNEAMFRILNRKNDRTYGEHVFFPGERICFKQNMTFSRVDWARQVSCSREIANNLIDVIDDIYDINPKGSYEQAMASRVSVRSTAAKKDNESWYRVITFKSGKQINLTDYSLFWLKRAYATTMHSTIGSETDRVIIYIHPCWRFLHRGVLYTAMTRAKREVIMVMDLNGDTTLASSDLAAIWKVPPPMPENTLVNYIPRSSDVVARRTQLLDRPMQFIHRGQDHIDDESSESPESDGHQLVNSRSITLIESYEVPTPKVLEVNGAF